MPVEPGVSQPTPLPRLTPRALAAPLPASGREAELPFEPEEVGERPPCRRCRRTQRDLEIELLAGHQALIHLEDLLVWLGEEHDLSHAAREHAEREVVALQALLHEFDSHARSHRAALQRGREVLTAARREAAEARRAAAAERERSMRLAREVERLKRSAARRLAPPPAPTPDREAILQAVSAGEAEAHRLELEAAVAAERRRAERFERYARALEGRLRQLAEGDAPATAAPAEPVLARG